MQERSVWVCVATLGPIIMAVTPDPQYITAERFTQLLLSPQLLLIASINLSSPHTGNAFLLLKTRLPVGQWGTQHCRCLNNTIWIITTLHCSSLTSWTSSTPAWTRGSPSSRCTTCTPWRTSSWWSAGCPTESVIAWIKLLTRSRFNSVDAIIATLAWDLRVRCCNVMTSVTPALFSQDKWPPRVMSHVTSVPWCHSFPIMPRWPPCLGDRLDGSGLAGRLCRVPDSSQT